jgi:ribosomal protein S12 methylthiotransferase
VPERAKEERRKRIMTAQQEVVAKRLEKQLGKRFSVLLEGTHHDTDLLLTGRARWQAPEVDGTIIINDIEPLGGRSVQAGDLVTVEITEVAGYDLVGAAVAVEAQR